MELHTDDTDWADETDFFSLWLLMEHHADDTDWADETDWGRISNHPYPSLSKEGNNERQYCVETHVNASPQRKRMLSEIVSLNADWADLNRFIQISVSLIANGTSRRWHRLSR